MALDVDQEILQDFLVEAGEILEQLSEELVELESKPDDAELLNSIFRGFHTVKGGAGFLALDPMVDICHASENVFDMLRNGELSVDTLIMDIVLNALDEVNRMFEEVRHDQFPEIADKALLKSLESVMQTDSSENAEVSSVNDTITADLTAETEIQDNSASESDKTIKQGNDSVIDEMSADDFEALLDSLHGKSGAPGLSADEEAQSSTGEEAQQASADDESSASTPAADNAPLSADGQVTTEPEPKPEPATTAPPSTKSAPEPIADTATLKSEAQSSAASASSNAHQTTQPSTKKSEKKPEPKANAKAAAPTPEATVRVDTSRLDSIMNLVGELVLVRNRLVTLGDSSVNPEVVHAVSNLDVVTSDLQMAVMKTRMQPIKKVFGRFPRVVRDLARSLNKEVDLTLIGEETGLDKNLVEALADPLVHLVRNAVDHGVEAPDVREANGKSRKGTITLSAEQSGDHILLSIQDDGAGMDANKLRELAVEKELMDVDSANRLTDKECYALIFAAGFSTKKEISDISGRGVGMDVVKTKIIQLNGTVDIDSTLGHGTKLNIKVPLTLAILPTLMVMLGKQIFALPLTSVNEIFHLDLTRTNVVDNQLVVIVRERAIPLFYLKSWLVQPLSGNRPDKGHVVIVSVANKRIGFVVDQLLGQEEVVIKPLGDMLQGTPGMAGATITGDGNIAMILDVPSLLKRYAQ